MNENSFPHAPEDWSPAVAEEVAANEGLELTEDHWDAIRGIQEYFDKADTYKARELTDALEERFHARGGLKYLYKLLPQGPVAQGCRLAGFNSPAGSVDQSFGSVV